MQAGSVSTLLANPVLLLKKLCEIEAAELVKEEFIEHNSVKYYGRVIASIGDGVYVEVIDRIYSRAISLESTQLLPALHSSKGESSVTSISKGASPLPQEMTQAQKESVLGRIVTTGWGRIGTQKVWVMCTPVSSFPSVSHPDSDTAATNYPSFSLDEGAFSFGHTVGPASLPKDNTGQFRLRGLGLTGAFSASAFSQYTVRPAGVWKRTEPVAGPLLTSNPLEGLTELYYGTASTPPEQTSMMNSPVTGIACKYSTEAGMTWPSLGVRPFGIYAGDLQTSRSFSYGHIIGCEAYAVQLPVVGYAAIRVGCAIGEDGELINASPWEGIPVLPKARCDANGYIAFYTDAVGDFGGGVICGRVDTSRGNKSDGNYAYVLRNYLPSYSAANNPVAGSSMAISGGEASAGKRMNIFTPNPPIATDNVSGGPVVSDAFLYDDMEIRGIAKGALGCNKGMTDGYMGWMEGKRYRMLTSGIMVQW